MELLPLIERWIHFLAGITWIGLLYYFNLVQAAAMAAANADQGGPGGAGITKYVLPRALWWFRWSALVTWLAGAALLGPRFMSAFTLQGNDVIIGLGAWLGTIMLLNVWGIIWPNQKKVLGLKPATDAEKAKARRLAFVTSRVNTALSIPMLFFMAAAGHGVTLFTG
ncbi:MAG TPA: urate hydroxylase PuuD [Gammaproteobacteria bacterium]|nr:urate hydroxylase PuuD [Gammaproteobacteria bacterium]